MQMRSQAPRQRSSRIKNSLSVQSFSKLIEILLDENLLELRQS